MKYRNWLPFILFVVWVLFWPKMYSPGQQPSPSVTIGWTDNGGDCFQVYRGTQFDQLSVIAGCVPEPVFIDTSVQRGRVYYYAVSAISEFGETDKSNVVTAVIPPPTGTGAGGC